MDKTKVRKVDPAEKKFNEDFGFRMKERKESKAITSEKLAELAGISYQWVSAIENGRTKRGVSLFVAHKVAKALGTSIEDLIGIDMQIDEDAAFDLVIKARERKKLKTA